MKRIHKIIVLMLIFKLFAINIFSGEGVGTTALSFLKLEGSAKIAGLGGVVCGISDDVSSIFGNPAGLGLVNNKEISLMYGMLYEGIVYNNIGYVHPIREVGSFGVGLRYISYGEIEGLDEYGNPTSNFTPTDLAIIISYAKELNGFNLGGSIKYISSKIRKTTQAVGLDLGVMKNGLLDNKLSVGLVIQNLGTKIKYNTEEESLPMNIKIGCGYKVIDNLLCGLDISLPNDNDLVVSLGGEYKYRINEDIQAKVRLGFTTLTKDVEGSLKGISIGLGGGYKTFGIDYAFVPYGELGQTHRISLVVKF